MHPPPHIPLAWHCNACRKTHTHGFLVRTGIWTYNGIDKVYYLNYRYDFWKLHFFWGRLYAAGPGIIQDPISGSVTQGTRESGQIKLAFLLEKSVQYILFQHANLRGPPRHFSNTIPADINHPNKHVIPGIYGFVGLQPRVTCYFRWLLSVRVVLKKALVVPLSCMKENIHFNIFIQGHSLSFSLKELLNTSCLYHTYVILFKINEMCNQL